MASYNSPRRKTLVWYKKIAVDLLSIAVVNSTIIYNEIHPGRSDKLTVLTAHEAIVRKLLQLEESQHLNESVEPRLRTLRFRQSNPGSSESSERPIFLVLVQVLC